MKKKLFLFLIVPLFAISQSKNQHDFFIQFNTSKFSNKVSLDSLLNHNAFKALNGKDSNTKISDFIQQMDRSKSMVIHGNLSDSIPYFQVTFPLAANNDINQFMQNKLEKENSSSEDTLKNQIKTFNNYKLYSPNKNSFTMAWNKDYLVIVSVLDDLKKSKHQPFQVNDIELDSTFMEIDSVAVEIAESEITTISPEETSPTLSKKTDTNADTEAVINEEKEENKEETEQKWEIEYKLEQEKNRLENQSTQEFLLARLFENTFQMPISSKTNPNSDISMWINYAAFYQSMSSFSRMLKSFTPQQNLDQNQASIIGMNIDFFFENNKARIEQAIEYDQPLAQIMQKVIKRKPNKNSFNYFPKKEPIGYMSYHFSSEEMLKNYPKIMDQAFSSLPVDKNDIEIFTDLISTIVDEKATASLFDGDFSLFLHDTQKYETTITETSYDENYEEVLTEQTVTKTRPIISMLFTTTHPTMSNKLIDLGIRKKRLIKENDYYIIEKSDDFGNLVMLKKQDVIIITNGLSYLNQGEKSSFSKQVKKELSSNNFSGNFEIQKFLNRYVNYDEFGTKKDNYISIFNRFKNIHFSSSNRITNNKNYLQMEINSNYSDKNVILQTLDLISLLN